MHYDGTTVCGRCGEMYTWHFIPAIKRNRMRTSGLYEIFTPPTKGVVSYEGNDADGNPIFAGYCPVCEEKYHRLHTHTLSNEEAATIPKEEYLQ